MITRRRIAAAAVLFVAAVTALFAMGTSNGAFMIANQKLRIGRSHAGKTVSVIVGDTVFRVLDGDIELSTHARLKTKPQQRFMGISQSTR